MIRRGYKNDFFSIIKLLQRSGIRLQNFYLKDKLVALSIFVLCAILFSFISFYKNAWLRIQFIPGSIVKAQVVAEMPFEFISTEKTSKLYKQKNSQASNVFVINEKIYDEFIAILKMLDEQIEGFSYEDTLTEAGRDEIRNFVNEFSSLNLLKLEWQDVAILVGSLEPLERTQIFQECISILREIARDGVFSEAISMGSNPDQTANALNLKLKDGKIRNVRAIEWALSYARKHLASINIDQNIASILFSILKQGIKPNLVYDLEESKTKFDTILKSMKPVMVKIKQGDIILRQGMKIDEEIYEVLDAYQTNLKSISKSKHGFDRIFYLKTLCGTISLMMIVFMISLVFRKKKLSLRILLLNGILVAIQLFVLRLLIGVGDLSIFSRDLLSVRALAFFPPVLCASGIAMLLHGTVSGALVSFVVSIYYTLMVEQQVDFLMILLFANFLFLSLLKNINFRVKIIRAGCFSAFIVGSILLLKSFVFAAEDSLGLYQASASVIMCVSSGIIIVAVLQFFESLFGGCSNITLFELVDYNHPLLKKLQIIAPGTYNHSLMASNIAEQVAIAVDANPVICKTGAVYHDIGKISKAEYFIENQSNQVNLHDQQTPNVSTLVIKNHIKDGIELAKEYRLPRIIRDVIQQHHGTTAVQFFYEKARREFIINNDISEMSNEEVEVFMSMKLDTSIFRYDGPRPQTKEVLIIMLADSIEAASRSMKRITHQAIDGLVNRIFDIKSKDHQFDDCPITFDEIRELKKAFSFTLLSLMHTRISYSPTDSNDDNGIG